MQDKNDEEGTSGTTIAVERNMQVKNYFKWNNYSQRKSSKIVLESRKKGLKFYFSLRPNVRRWLRPISPSQIFFFNFAFFTGDNTYIYCQCSSKLLINYIFPKLIFSWILSASFGLSKRWSYSGKNFFAQGKFVKERVEQSYKDYRLADSILRKQ